jgi:hypothetical protein
MEKQQSDGTASLLDMSRYSLHRSLKISVLRGVDFAARRSEGEQNTNMLPCSHG